MSNSSKKTRLTKMNETYTIKLLVEFQVEWYRFYEDPCRITNFNQSKVISCLRTKFQVEKQHSSSSFALTSRSIVACIKPWFGLKSLQNTLPNYQHILQTITLH